MLCHLVHLLVIFYFVHIFAALFYHFLRWWYGLGIFIDYWR